MGIVAERRELVTVDVRVPGPTPDSHTAHVEGMTGLKRTFSITMDVKDDGLDYKYFHWEQVRRMYPE